MSTLLGMAMRHPIRSLIFLALLGWAAWGAFQWASHRQATSPPTTSQGSSLTVGGDCPPAFATEC
jgi:hypothetical protein